MGPLEAMAMSLSKEQAELLHSIVRVATQGLATHGPTLDAGMRAAIKLAGRDRDIKDPQVRVIVTLEIVRFPRGEDEQGLPVLRMEGGGM